MLLDSPNTELSDDDCCEFGVDDSQSTYYCSVCHHVHQGLPPALERQFDLVAVRRHPFRFGQCAADADSGGGGIAGGVGIATCVTVTCVTIIIF